MSILGSMFAMGMMGDDIIDMAMRQQVALHGLLICLEIIEPDEEISGKEVLERAERYVKGHLEGNDEEQ